MLLRAIAITDDGGQTLAVFGPDEDAYGLNHASIVARLSLPVNPPFASIR
jgi:hypothetical protein